MAFDLTNTTHLIALQNEINTDPLGMGYASQGGTPPILDLLNNPEKNLGGETTGSILTPRDLLDAIEPADLTVGNKFSQGQLEFLKMIIEMSASMDDNIEDYRVKITELFNWTPVPQTKLNLDAQNRKLSRAEVLFGVDTVISKNDWLAARDYQS